MTTEVIRIGATVSLALALVGTSSPAAQSLARGKRGTEVVQYCAPSNSWDVVRVFCGRDEG